MSRLLLSPEKIELLGDADEEIFSTDLPMMAVLDSYQGQIVTAEHAALLNDFTFKLTDHLIGPVNPAADRTIGWGRVVSPASTYLPVNRPFNLSGSHVLTGRAYNPGGGFGVAITTLITLAPFVTSGNLYLREEWVNGYRNTTPVYPPITIPSMTIDYDLRAVAFVGGN